VELFSYHGPARFLCSLVMDVGNLVHDITIMPLVKEK
jgi:hypothetical protein